MSRDEKPRQPKTGGSPQVEARRWSRRGALTGAIAVLLAATLAANVVVGGLVLHNLFWSGSPPGPPKAAIVDQLGLTQPNLTFAQTATNMLEQAGYLVDYYPGDQVTVDLYRNLPTHDYDLLILRVHSAIATEVNAAGSCRRCQELPKTHIIPLTIPLGHVRLALPPTGQETPTQERVGAVPSV